MMVYLPEEGLFSLNPVLSYIWVNEIILSDIDSMKQVDEFVESDKCCIRKHKYHWSYNDQNRERRCSIWMRESTIEPLVDRSSRIVYENGERECADELIED